MRQECRGPRSLIVYIRRFNVKSHEQQFSRVSLYACQVPKCAVQQFPPADFTPVWRWIWPFGPVCGFSPRTGDCRAASVRCGFSRFGEVEVELGWMICAPRRAGYLPSRTRANLISPERAGESVSRSGKANLRTRLRGSFRRYRFRPWWLLTRRLLHLTVFEEWCPVPSTAIGNDLRARSGSPAPRRKAACIFEKHRRRDRGSTSSRRPRIRVSGWRLLCGARHPEQRMQVSRHHRIPAAAGVSVEPRKRRRLEGEHREARHQAVGKARASGPDRTGDAAEMLSHRFQHPGHRKMPAEGFFVMFPPDFAIKCRFRAKSPQKSFLRSSQSIVKHE